ncbi:MAG TPA: hemerythrin domain-containing protein [Dongiaceae bacterium]|nr:hemerythrin domain-containing protein [Dongiaceae bacterium]
MPTTQTSTRSRSASRGARRSTAAGRSRAGSDAIALLKSDHREVAEMVEQYESGKERRRAPAKQSLAEKICKALTVHAAIEEEIFYPAVAAEVEDAEDLVEEARVEHESVKHLISQIEDSKPDEAQYDAKVKVLGEYVKHHVKEEEGSIFPKLRKSGMDLKELGERLAQRKEELAAE